MSEDTRGVLGHIGGALHSAKDVADIAKEGIVTGSLLFNGAAAPPPCTPLDTHFDPPAISQELDPAECPQLQDSFMDSLNDLADAKESELRAAADRTSADLEAATVAKNEPVAALDLGPDDMAEIGLSTGMDMGGAVDGGMDIGGAADMGGMDIGGADMGGMDMGGPGGMGVSPESAEHSLAQLASEVVDLKLPVRVDPGTIVLAFRNGAPLAALKPGRVHRRIVGGLPGMGRLKGMTLTTADIPLEVTVRDVRVNGIHPLEAVKVTLTVAIDPREDFQGVLDYAGRKGINFPQLLLPELRAEIEQRVRNGVKEFSSEEIYEARMGLDPASFGTAPLLEGLFSIERIFFGEPTFHSGFIEERDIRIRKRAERVEKVEDLAQHDINLLLEQSEDIRLLEQAKRRGMSLPEFESPELIQASLQRDHELRLALVEQLGELRRAGGADAVNRMMEMLAGGVAPPTPTPAVGPRPSARADDVIAGISPVSDDTGLSGLLADRTLEELWMNEGLPGEPLGLGRSGATVVVVAREDLNAAIEGRIGDLYRRRAAANEVLVLDNVHSLNELVFKFLRARLPEAMASVTAVRTTTVGSRLTVVIGSDSGRVTHLTQRLNDPAAGVFDPLAQVLPHDVIDVRAATA